MSNKMWKELALSCGVPHLTETMQSKGMSCQWLGLQHASPHSRGQTCTRQPPSKPLEGAYIAKVEGIQGQVRFICIDIFIFTCPS